MKKKRFELSPAGGVGQAGRGAKNISGTGSSLCGGSEIRLCSA